MGDICPERRRGLLTRWIINSAWPYVNSVPHLGTFIHLLSADVYARYLRLKGDEVIAVTGSDEHGTPIEVEAIRKGVPPKQLTDQIHNQILQLLDAYNIHLDNYTRTESPVHIRYTQELYRKVYENGYIYTQNVNLPYCQTDQRFLPDRFVEGTCPHCGNEKARGDQCESCGRVLDPLELVKPPDAYSAVNADDKILNPLVLRPTKVPRQTLRRRQREQTVTGKLAHFSLRWLEEGLKTSCTNTG